MKKAPLNPFGMVIDSWAESIGSVCWAQDQTEQLVRSWMDQGKLARDQGRELSRQLAGQTKRNQVELQKFIHNSVALSLDTLQKNQQLQMTQMQAQVEQMSQLVSSLQAKLRDIEKH
jgi:polyhydroxyalkanoate synthesis regulator phasin